jgi:putative polyketide hydroxylase
MSMEEIVRETRRYGNHLGIEFGTTYHSTAVITDGTTPPDVDDSFADYTPSASPGCRAPHIWLGSDNELLSTNDLFGPSFTVLTGPQGDTWRPAAARAAQQLQVPISTYLVGGPGLTDPAAAFLAQYEINPDGAVLIRPDGYIAWRSTSGPTDDASLVSVLAQILGRRT